MIEIDRWSKLLQDMVPAERPLGTSQEPVQHMSYMWSQLNPRAYGHHTLSRRAEPGRIYQCGLCGRWVFRGKGRWWE